LEALVLLWAKSEKRERRRRRGKHSGVTEIYTYICTKT
jgi:hypothetical protein